MIEVFNVDLDTAAGRASWLAKRRSALGSSEIPALMGHGYSNQSDWQIWNSKLVDVGPEMDEEPDHLWFGRRVQRVIGEASTLKLGFDFSEGDEWWFHPQHRIGATIDFVAMSTDQRYVINETKNRTSWAMQSVDDGPLPHDVIQLACQCFLARERGWELYPTQYVSALIDGQELKSWPLALDKLAELEPDIIRTAGAFWDLVQTRTPPPLSPVDLPAWLLQQGPTLDDTILELEHDDELDAAVAAYHHANAVRKLAAKDEDRAKAKLVDALGDHKRMVTAGYTVAQSRAVIKAATIERKEHVRLTLKVSQRPPASAQDMDAEPNIGDIPTIAAG